jgi:hypothetical protein
MVRLFLSAGVKHEAAVIESVLYLLLGSTLGNNSSLMYTHKLSWSAIALNLGPLRTPIPFTRLDISTFNILRY